MIRQTQSYVAYEILIKSPGRSVDRGETGEAPTKWDVQDPFTERSPREENVSRLSAD